MRRSLAAVGGFLWLSQKVTDNNSLVCTVHADQEDLTTSFCFKNGVVYRLSMAMCSIFFS